MGRTSSPYRFICAHCGRQWDTKGRSRSSDPARAGKSNVTGFIASASDNHQFHCGFKTPAMRRAANARDEARWLRDPPRASRIWNDPAHPGLLDASPSSGDE